MGENLAQTQAARARWRGSSASSCASRSTSIAAGLRRLTSIAPSRSSSITRCPASSASARSSRSTATSGALRDSASSTAASSPCTTTADPDGRWAARCAATTPGRAPASARTSAARACSASRRVTERPSYSERRTSGWIHWNGSSPARISTRRIASAASAAVSGSRSATAAAWSSRPLVPITAIAIASPGAAGPSDRNRPSTWSPTSISAAAATSADVRLLAARGQRCAAARAGRTGCRRWPRRTRRTTRRRRPASSRGRARRRSPRRAR